MATFVALGWRFTVRADEASHQAYLDDLLGAFPVSESPGCPVYAVRAAAEPGRYELRLDDELVVSGRPFAAVVSSLVHDLNRRVIGTSPYLALHAGGVEVDGVTVVLPGHMEAGKTTLTAGLVRAGARYLSDEAVAVGGDELRVVPYPKPLSIDAGAQRLFPELDPRARLGEDGVLDQWQVAPQRIARDAVGRGGGVPGVVVFPRYVEGAETVLEPVRGGDALVELAKNTFRFNEQARCALDRLARLRAGARVYRLTSGDLRRSVDAVLGLADGRGV